MKSFASDSTIHGVSFIFGEHRNKFSRFLWLFLLFSSFCGFSFYISSSYSKYRFTPDIAMRRMERNASDFSMSAITICPKYFFMPESVKKNTTKNSHLTKSECEVFAGNVHWCLPHLADELRKDCESYSQDIDNINVVDILNKTAFKTYDLVPTHYPYVRAFTHHGICYSVNTQNFEAIFNKEEIHDDFHCYNNEDYPNIEWTVERGYFRENVTYPWYIRSMNGYRFYLKLSNNEAKNLCYTSSMYFIIHLPNEVPTEFHKMIPIAYASTSTIILTAKSHRTDDALRAYSPEVRKCYFEGERKLRFFKSYSKAHCDLECYRNDTLNACNCVLFWMPRSNSTRICQLSELSCIEGIRNYYVKRKITSCNCHPSCNNIEYEVAFYSASTINVKSPEYVTGFSWQINKFNF